MVKEINIAEVIVPKGTTKSETIRYLASQNISRSQIAQLLNIKYQFVRNVLVRPLKKV